MAILPGRRLGPSEILSAIGAGATPKYLHQFSPDCVALTKV
jgi:hypothetical protein